MKERKNELLLGKFTPASEHAIIATTPLPFSSSLSLLHVHSQTLSKLHPCGQMSCGTPPGSWELVNVVASNYNYNRYLLTDCFNFQERLFFKNVYEG